MRVTLDERKKKKHPGKIFLRRSSVNFGEYLSSNQCRFFTPKNWFGLFSCVAYMHLLQCTLNCTSEHRKIQKVKTHIIAFIYAKMICFNSKETLEHLGYLIFPRMRFFAFYSLVESHPAASPYAAVLTSIVVSGAVQITSICLHRISCSSETAFSFQEKKHDRLATSQNALARFVKGKRVILWEIISECILHRKCENPKACECIERIPWLYVSSVKLKPFCHSLPSARFKLSVSI